MATIKKIYVYITMRKKSKSFQYIQIQIQEKGFTIVKINIYASKGCNFTTVKLFEAYIFILTREIILFLILNCYV